MQENNTVKNVLIVSELFHPTNCIGAIRPTKLAKKLAQVGYGVDVFTATACSNSEYHVGEGYRIVSRCGVDRTRENAAPTSRKLIMKMTAHLPKRGRILTALATLYRHIRHLNKSKNFERAFLEEIAEGRLDLLHYDCIVTTFSPIHSILVGLKAKQLRPELRWICDFRDPMVSQIRERLVVPLYAYLQRKSIRLADCVTTVSNGYKKRIMPKEHADKCVVIPNGYDADDWEAVAQVQQSEKFSFAYVGSLYEGKRDLSLLFRAIREALDAGLIRPEALEFHYAGTEGEFLRQQAAGYDLQSIIIDHGQLSRETCLQLQASVRFLVMSTWNDKGEEGVFPGKLIEYMLMKKPVVNIVGGKLPDCEVTQVIRELKLGVSCEEADRNTYEDLRNWLTEQCEAYCAGEEAVFHPMADEIEARYNWKNIVKRFGELIDG